MKEIYLKDISLVTCPQLPLETLNKRQEDLSRKKALLPLEEKGKPLYNLQELPQFKEPKSNMIFQNLYKLKIEGYKQLKFIFSASTSRRLQKLRKLEVEDCEELVSIIEDQENNKNPMATHQGLFPELRTIKVRDCKSMEYLFSISSGKLPRLLYVDIEDTPQLEEVFRWKHGEGQKLVMEDVFPSLDMIRLVNLPTLHTICQGIDFHTVKFRRVRECPTISLISANDSYEELNKLLVPIKRTSVHEDEDTNYVTMILTEWDSESEMEDEMECLKANREGYTEHEQNRISPNLSESEKVSKDIVEEDSTSNSNFLNLIKSTKTSANKIIEEKLSTTPSSDLDMNLKATFGEGPSSEKYGKANSSKLRGKESMDDDQQPNGESRISNEAPHSIEEPTKEWSSKETLSDVSLKIPPPSTTAMTFAQSSSISSPEKLQIPTSASHEEMESGSSQSDLLTISTITDESIQEKIMNQPESSTAKQVKFDQGNHQQFAEDDLMKLFQIMEEGAEMEVHMSHVSKIAAVHDDNQLIKALADLEGSLKISLNEIASSIESRFRLENALNILSSHCFEHGVPSHGLQTTIHTLQQEIQNVLSSSKQAYATIDTFNMLEHKEKLFTEERSNRKEAAVALLSEIYNKESSLAEASLKEAELKEQISKLHAELDRKEKQVQEHEMELISLKEQKKKSVYDTMGFIKEFEAVKKERSHMVEENMNAKEHLQNMDVKWSSCLSNLKKTILLLGVHLQQKV
ncbi:hypothetical protein QN277_009663 [Acacia crassicarpa]|uniref:Disease resistance protein At4g27190-like leucine-rich repeats domain-containing protein n=1 Tax=Acacia crassicarpa TaxID=499986 RepID=A0AAE1M733_9FABA|nr:hypothetical protein QN277_009663 [Acacia crassicarpa]